MNPLKLNVIIGTVRPGRAADPVARWVAQRASEHGAFEVEVLDLRDWPLPHFAEGPDTVGDFNVFVSFAFRNKPAAFVGYSGGIAAGVRAVEHLAQVAIEAEMVPLRNTILIPQVHNAFDADGQPTNEVAERSIAVTLDDLAWWGRLLANARAAGQLAPAQAREIAIAKAS